MRNLCLASYIGLVDMNLGTLVIAYAEDKVCRLIHPRGDVARVPEGP